MKRYLTFIIMLLLGVSTAAAEGDKKAGPEQLFYTANGYYEKRDYAKAIEEYMKIVDLGLESGNLYYNIGNSFLKLGKTGYSILFYERARRLVPQDSDLKANLSYARSQVGDPADGAGGMNVAARIFRAPFRQMRLNAIVIFAAICYLVLVLLQALFIFKPMLKRRVGIVGGLMLAVFIFISAAFGFRYYDEEICRAGIVVQRDVECKYEPIDTSTTYYTLPEGRGVAVMRTRNGWRQVRRPDGKIGWVRKEAVEEI